MRKIQGTPFHIRAGLIGVRTRKQAWIQLWVAIAVSMLLFLVLDVGSSFFWTLVYVALVLLTANWYFACIRWVDGHGGWDEH